MGLLDVFFKSRKSNLFDEITDKIAEEEKKKTILKSPFLKVQSLTLNRDNLFCFVIATFCFELEFNPIFKSVCLKKEYSDLIEKIKGYEAFQLIHKSMLDYYHGKSTSPTSHWNITYTYLEKVWGIKERVRDPVLVTVYSVYLTEIRITMKKEFENSMASLLEP
jgi:hypothetical protein